MNVINFSFPSFSYVLIMITSVAIVDKQLRKEVTVVLNVSKNIT